MLLWLLPMLVENAKVRTGQLWLKDLMSVGANWSNETGQIPRAHDWLSDVLGREPNCNCNCQEGESASQKMSSSRRGRTDGQDDLTCSEDRKQKMMRTTEALNPHREGLSTNKLASYMTSKTGSTRYLELAN